VAFEREYQTMTPATVGTNSTAKSLNMSSLRNAASKPKKFNTELTDYSESHSDKTGPYAENLDVDALVVGAGFGKLQWQVRVVYKLTG
jgi:hypothetical protein